METKNLSAALYTTVKQSGQIARYANHPEVAVRIDILEQFARLTRDNNIPVKRAASDCNVGLSTIYRWHHNYRKKGLGGLVNGSRRPHRCRQRQWTDDHLEAIVKLREQHPHWGKTKIHPLLKQEGFHLSQSTVGQMISKLIRSKRIARCPKGRAPSGKAKILDRGDMKWKL